jgi:hypothetical protein
MMANPPRTRWSAYEAELRNVSIPVKAPVSSASITSATLSLGATDLPMVVSADPDGYKLAISGLSMPGIAGVYQWKAKVLETGFPTPLVVAIGDLHVRNL